VLIIGERFNSSIKKVEQAIQAKDSAFIQSEAKLQAEAGADVIDLNAGTLIKSEPEEIVWLIQAVREALGGTVRIAIDSVNPKAIAAGLEEIAKVTGQEKPIINSVTAEKEKLDAVLPLAEKFRAVVVGMCMDENGIPEEPETRSELGGKILKAAAEYNISAQDVYLDPLVLPVSTDVKKGQVALTSIKLIKELDPEVKTIIGLSNISYGLPEKPLLNRTFLAMAMAMGLDAAILNPLDKQLMNMIKAAEVILGNDEFCMKYITAYRNGEFNRV